MLGRELTIYEQSLRTTALSLSYDFTDQGLSKPERRGGNEDCPMVVAAPMLPAGYVVNASRIADRRMILAAYRLPIC